MENRNIEEDNETFFEAVEARKMAGVIVLIASLFFSLIGLLCYFGSKLF